jgi:hypothetical protein
MTPFFHGLFSWVADKKRLLEQKGIFWVELHPKSKSSIVRYHPSEIQQREILTQIREFLEEKDLILPKPIRKKGSGSKIAHFGGLSVSMVYVFIKKVLLKQPIAQGPFSFLGIIVGFSSLSTLKSALDDWKQSQKMSLELFIGGTALVAVVVGEAITALEVLWIERGASLLKGLVPFSSWFSCFPALLKGANTLFSRGLKVEVLDATAIFLSLKRRDYLTANAINFLITVGGYLEESTERKSHHLIRQLLKPPFRKDLDRKGRSGSRGKC